MITASMAPPPVIDLTHGTTSLGTWFFWPSFLIGLLLIVAGTAVAIGVREGWPLTFTGIGTVIAVIAVIAYWPVFDRSYHRWYPVTGIAAVNPDSRLISDGDKVSQRFALRLEGSPQLFGCDDTRCSTVRQGDHVYLLCKREWQFRGVPGWSCVFNQP